MMPGCSVKLKCKSFGIKPAKAFSIKGVNTTDNTVAINVSKNVSERN
jgi:hypothetical protein